MSFDSKEDELFQCLCHRLDFDNLIIDCVYSVVSLKLALAFCNYKSLQIKRKQETLSLFVSKEWEQNDNNGLRKITMDQFDTKVSSYTWNITNAEKLSPILPALFCSEEEAAWQFVNTGFQTKTDGSYGTGFYMTTSAEYLLPHLITKIEPTIIICLTLPGYPYPVISELDVRKHKGLVQGHQSHYVLTKPDGTPADGTSAKYYDELVLDQEGQILPVFVVSIKKANLEQLSDRFKRKKREDEGAISSEGIIINTNGRGENRDKERPQ